MLIDNFFKIIENSGPEEEVNASGILVRNYSFRISTQPDHVVYQGHFPDNPVTPGVFQVQIVHELVSKIAGTPLRLVLAENIKYLNPMIPSLNNFYDCKIAIKITPEGLYNVTASLFREETVFIKFKGKYRPDDI